MKRIRSRKNSGFKFTKTALLVASACASTVAAAAFCYDGGNQLARALITLNGQIAVSAVPVEGAKVRGSFDSAMTAMDTAVGAAFKWENEQISSAMRVFVKQMSVSSNLLAENTVKVAQNEAAVEQARLQKDKYIETTEKLGAPGQGHKVCTVLSEREKAAQVYNSNQKNVSDLVTTTVYAAPGTYAQPYNVQQEMNKIHAEKYCTAEQASAGYCSSATNEAGWDLQMSTLFTPTTADSSVFDAQNALINNMVGLPDAPISEMLRGSPTASNYLILKQRKDALVSPAINSLKSIQAEFAGMKNPDNAVQISPIKAMNDQVKRYLGSGDEYKAWSQTLVGASEDGIMRELLQVFALDLHLQMRQYKQYEREELLLAGIVGATQQLIDKKNTGRTSMLSAEDEEKSRLASRSITSSFYKSINKIQ